MISRWIFLCAAASHKARQQPILYGAVFIFVVTLWLVSQQLYPLWQQIQLSKADYLQSQHAIDQTNALILQRQLAFSAVAAKAPNRESLLASVVQSIKQHQLVLLSTSFAPMSQHGTNSSPPASSSKLNSITITLQFIGHEKQVLAWLSYLPQAYPRLNVRYMNWSSSDYFNDKIRVDIVLSMAANSHKDESYNDE